MAASWIETGRIALRSAGLGSMALLLSSALVHAQTVDVKTKVLSLQESGAIELVLPKDQIVAIGDKIEFETPLSSQATDEKPDVVWSVQGLKDGVIIAEPSAKPEKMPELGYRATIRTLANQPMILSSSEAKIKAAETDSANDAAGQMGEGNEATKPVDTKPAPTAVSEPEVTKVQATGSQEPAEEGVAATSGKVESQDTSEKTETSETALPAKPEAAAKEPEVAAKKAEQAPTEPQKAQPEEPAEPATKADAPMTAPEKAVSSEPSRAKAKSADMSKPVVRQETVAPAPEMDCDHLAAHPFDPDAVAKGVFYADLDADKVIAACQDAIAAYPQEARFYTQLTRGLHKAGKLDLARVATQKGADLGSGQSMAYLGVMYKNGEQVAQDQSQALAWFEKAAEKGNPGGMVFAASMYRDGVGTTRNYKRAAELYKMASDRDIAEASADLGIFYDRGQGVERSAEQAANLLLKAYAQDDKDTQQIFFEAPGVLSEETRKAVQIALKDRGFYKGAIDADFGSGTRRALILYKRNVRH